MKLLRSSLQTPQHRRSSLVYLASLAAGAACGEPPREHEPAPALTHDTVVAPLVDKAELLTLTDPRGFPDAEGAPNRPDQYARAEDGELFFLRPDTERSYYLVIADDAPEWLFEAFVLATDDIESASTGDCLGASVFVPTRESVYRELGALELAGSSTIDVEYSEEACDGLAAGCANAPRLEPLASSAPEPERRLRFGTFIGLESTYDGGDADTAPDLNPSTARAVVLHELSHTLGFSHPRYTLEPDVVPEDLRVPTTSQGTLPTMMVPTSNALSSDTVTADDRRALEKTYGGECGYSSEWRSLGRLCSLPSEALCLQHGGSCEVDAAGVELCRWPHFTNAEDCSSYSAGTWQACGATVLAGEAGACIDRADALAECVTASMEQSPEDLAGRCCTQFDGEPGVFFPAFGDASSTTFLCSEQHRLWDSPRTSLRFTEATADVTVSNRRLKSGCVSSLVSTTGAGESGIVFNYVDAESHYVFDVSQLRRRIRRVVGGVSTTLSDVPYSGAAGGASAATLMVCFGDGIHTFIDDAASSRISIDTTVSFFGTGGRIGLWGNSSEAAELGDLRSFPLVHGFSLLR